MRDLAALAIQDTGQHGLLDQEMQKIDWLRGVVGRIGALGRSNIEKSAVVGRKT